MSPAESPWPTHNDAPPPPQAAPSMPAMPAAMARDQIHQKIPLLAGLLSGFPGLGNLYNGLYIRALVQFLIVASLITIAGPSEGALIPMSVVFFWGFAVLDAYRQALLINYGYSQDLGLLDLPQRPKAGMAGMAAGVILTVIGIVAFLEQYWKIELEWLYDLWPLMLVGVGLWLIVASIRDKSKSSSS